MISELSGYGDTLKILKEHLGKVISDISIQMRGEDAESLRLCFSDGSVIEVFDDGQSCCERRYMVCDDKLEDFKGATLTSMELRDGPTDESDDVHEIQFLLVNTSKGTFTVSNHNEHNGYYGGFSLNIRKMK